MRYFILFGIPALILFGVLWAAGFTWFSKQKPGPAALNAGASPKALGTASNAVRALDQILTDPTLIGSSEWRKEAQTVINQWYNKG